MSDYPPFLTVGTEISAKFKGAFCEAKIKKALRSVKCRVVFKDLQIPSCVVDENLIKGPLKVGAYVEAPHPETKHYSQATIQHIKDCSTYTVVFDDGDERVLRRRQMCIKGGRHFAASESLDVMPLTKPEQFGAPVRLKSGYKIKSIKSEPVDSNSDSDSVDSILDNTKELTIGTKIRVQYGTGSRSAGISASDGPPPKCYIAKIVKILNPERYKVHYLGWNTRYDEIIDSSRILEILPPATDDDDGPQETAGPSNKDSGGGTGTGPDSSDDAPPPLSIGHSPRSASNKKTADSTSFPRKRRFSNGSTRSLRTDSPNFGKNSTEKAPVLEKSFEILKDIKREIDDPDPDKQQPSSSHVIRTNSPLIESANPLSAISNDPIGQDNTNFDDDQSTSPSPDQPQHDSSASNLNFGPPGQLARRVSKRLRGENPSECENSAAGGTSGIPNFGNSADSAISSNSGDPESEQQQSHVTSCLLVAPADDNPSPVIDNLFDRIMRHDLIDDLNEHEKNQAETSLGLKMIKRETEEDEESYIEKQPILSTPSCTPKKLTVDSSTALNNDERCHVTSSSSQVTCPGHVPNSSSAKKSKSKRRRRNYSQMVTESHRKPAVKSHRRETTESDNEINNKNDCSPKDSNNFHALKLRVQAEMDRDPNYRPIYTSEVIDENMEAEQKIQMLQQFLMELKETYVQVKAEALYLERKRKKILEKKRKQLPKPNRGPNSSGGNLENNIESIKPRSLPEPVQNSRPEK